MSMVTYADLFQFCMLIVSLVGLCHQDLQGQKNRVGGKPNRFPDLSHHRAYRSVHGGSINLTSNTPFGVVI